MSVYPRHVAPKSFVIIEFKAPITPSRPSLVFVRVTVVDPEGVKSRVMSTPVLLWPTSPESRSEPPRPRHALYEVATDAPLGCYRVKIEFFIDGILHYSETLNDDFFFVEHLKVDPLESEADCSVRLFNPSREPIAARLLEEFGPGSADFRERTIQIPPGEETTIPLSSSRAFLTYADMDTIPLAAGGRCCRNPRFFWREEDDETVFVLDPRAEQKRNFFLTGRAREIWHRADGTRTIEDVCSGIPSSVYSSLVARELIVEEWL